MEPDEFTVPVYRKLLSLLSGKSIDRCATEEGLEYRPFRMQSGVPLPRRPQAPHVKVWLSV